MLGDEARLTQVAMNLIENAFKYSDPTQEVVLRLSRAPDQDRGWAQLEVQDHGSGISAHDQRSVFTRFLRGSREGRAARGGLGLGLYIARGIVEQHGGTIELDSSEGAGTRVSIRLPLGLA